MLPTLPAVAFIIALAAQAVQTPPAPAPAAAPDAAARQQAAEQKLLMDWPNLARYREENAKLPPPAAGEQRVVFIGDSITDGWGRRPRQPLLHGKAVREPRHQRADDAADAGAIPPGRHRPQPAAVVILAGINDIAENTGPTTIEAIEDNLTSMTDLAQANGIKVVLASVTPAVDFPWRPGKMPRPRCKR